MARCGIGAFLRKLPGRVGSTKTQKALDRTIKKFVDAGMQHAAFMVTFQGSKSQRTNDPRMVRQWAEGFAKHGIRVGLWGYPWIGREDVFMQAMDAAWCDPISFGILNAEGGMRVTPAGQHVPIGYKFNAGSELRVRARAAHMTSEFAAWCERRKLDNIFSSYGIMHQHGNFPWEQFLASHPIMSPQLYNASVSDSQLAFSDWRAASGSVTVIQYDKFLMGIGAFGSMSGSMMDETLSRYTNGFPGLLGGIVWSEPQIDRSEYAAIKLYSDVWR